MTAAKRYLPHYTVEDYRQWEGDWELWDGIAVAMTPSPFGRHQWAASELMYQLRKAIEQNECDAKTLHEIDWIIRDDTVVRPDVLVICGGVPDEHVRETPALVAEVISESTETRDRTYKRELYDQQGVAVYLLLDPAAKTLEAYHRNAAGNWVHEQVADSIELRLCETCEIQLFRADLFSD
jgi:Uma2 family endonuclease